jgi:hypothetical protein
LQCGGTLLEDAGNWQLKRMSQTPLNIRRELGIVLITIYSSVLILPGLIFAVGSRLFGAYASTGGASTGGFASIYQATLTDLLTPKPAAWIIVVGPALCIALLRLTFRLTQPNETPAPASQRKRREPTLSA